jgi:hypothetical protein
MVDEAACLDFAPIAVVEVTAAEEAVDELALDAFGEKRFGIAGHSRHALTVADG